MPSEISSAKDAEIKNKSVIGLPNTVTGKPDIVKNAIYDPVDSVIKEVNRIVKETNESLKASDDKITENKNLINKNANDIQTNKANIEKNKANIEKNQEKNNDEFSKLREENKALADKLKTVLIFDMYDSKLNHGFPNGLQKDKTLVTDLTPYERIYCTVAFKGHPLDQVVDVDLMRGASNTSPPHIGTNSSVYTSGSVLMIMSAKVVASNSLTGISLIPTYMQVDTITKNIVALGSPDAWIIRILGKRREK